MAESAAEDESLFGAAMIADPYRVYRQLREFDPIRWEPTLSAWILTRYDDVVAVLRDPRFSAERTARLEDYASGSDGDLSALYDLLASQMLFADPPRHTRLRGLVNKAFTPRAVEAMRPYVQAVVDRLLDAAQGAGRMEVIHDLAYPLPVTVILEMLGLPEADREQFRAWSDDFALVIGNIRISPEDGERALRAGIALRNYFQGMAARLLADPRDDLLSALARAEEAGDHLSEDELLANSILLLVAGHETTTNLIGNGTLALLRHPAELEKLRADPSLVPDAVDELLRYESPVQLTGRMATEDVEVGGQWIRAGEFALLVLGAANRDPAQFPDPDQLNVTRAERRHVAFGHGPHFCLGAALARLEGEVAFTTLLRRFPNLRLADDQPEYRPMFNLRGLKSLVVEF